MSQYEKLPQEIKGTWKFCLYKLGEPNAKGKRDKVPYNPRTGGRAQSNNPATFTGFNTALTKIDGYDGLGVGMFADVVGIDIDGCVTNEKPNAMAMAIIALMNSPAELSPSGTGVHIYCKASGFVYDKAKYYINNQKRGIEVYVAGATKKFLTVTGHIINDAAFGERGEQLQTLLDTYMLRPEAIKKLPAQGSGSYLSDASVVEKAMGARNGDLFCRLFSEGDITGFASASEADMSLATQLAFWCGRNADQMDRVFRMSRLYREKWDRPQSGSTYGRITLEKAAANVTAVYKPDSVRKNAAEDFGDKLPLDKLRPESNSRYEWNDIGFGNLFADVYKDTLRYVPERKSWFYYDGTRWRQDIANLGAMEKAKRLISQLMSYALNTKDERRREVFVKTVIKLFSRHNRETILRDAQSVHPVSMERFDNHIYLFNCLNGTYDFQTNAFREHRPEDFLTKMSGVHYDPSAKCERWMRFTDEIMSGDKNRERFMQKSYGYGLTGDTALECLFILYGPSTRNGKGTLTETMVALAGDYGATARPETIGSKTGNNSGAPSEDVARLAGIRIASISEPDKKLVVNAALLKSMTGNDTLNARFLHENSFDFKPQFKLFINCNHLPAVQDMTLFDSDRIRIIPFERHFGEHEREPGLKAFFARQENISAIFNWCAEGYQLYKAEGLKMPGSVKEATAEYRRCSDKAAMFIDECLVTGVDAEVRTAEVYSEYRSWCTQCGYYPESSKNFNASVAPYLTIVRRRPRSGGGMTTLIDGARLLTLFERE